MTQELEELNRAMSVGTVGKPTMMPKGELIVESFEAVLHMKKSSRSQARNNYYNIWLGEDTPEWKQAQKMVKRLKHVTRR